MSTYCSPSILFILFLSYSAFAQECCDFPTLPGLAVHEPVQPFSVGISYGYTTTDELQSGTHSVSLATAGKRYPTLPTEMASYRVDARISYTFDERYGVDLSIPWIRNTMSLITAITPKATTMANDHSCCYWGGRAPSTTQREDAKTTLLRHSMDPVDGFGDLLIEGSLRLLRKGTPESGLHQLYFRPGLKIPTGDYRVKSNGIYIDPCMQPGSGSWDPIAQFEYRFAIDKAAVSLMGGYQLATRNPQGYKFGDVASFGIFPSYQPFRMFRLTTGLRYRCIDPSTDHKGRYTDKRMSSKDPANTGADLADAIVSLDFLPTASLTLNVGVSVPVWSDLNGIQQSPGELYTAGASVRF